MITTPILSKRIYQFFDYIFGPNKIDYGFSSVSNESFNEETIDQAIRPSYDFSSTDFINSDLDLAKWKLSLVGNRAIDVYIRNVLGKTIPQISTLTLEELKNTLNLILNTQNFYYNIEIQNFELDNKINDLLIQAQTGNLNDINSVRRLNKMLLCSIYKLEIINSSIYLTPRLISTLLFYRIEDSMLGNGIQSFTSELNNDKIEIISSIKEVTVNMNILSKKYLAKDAINFFNYAIQSERKDLACYNSNLAFDLILVSKTKPVVLTALEQGAWTERVEQKLVFKYLDSLTLDKVDILKEITTFEEVKNTIPYNSEIKE